MPATAKAKAKEAKAARPFKSSCPFGAFRDNTAKAAVSMVLSDKKFHALDELKNICTKHGVVPAQVHYAMVELKARAKAEFKQSPDGTMVKLVKATKAT